MAMVFPNEGEVQLITDLLGAGENWQLGLFVSNITPAESDVAATYTAAEASGGWYSRKTLTRSISGSTWSTPASQSPWSAWTPEASVGGSSYNAASPLSWTSTASLTVYGVFVLGATSGKLIFAEAFASPAVLTNGTTLTYTPRFQLA